MKALVLFPGKTDEAVYGPIVEGLKKEGIEFELRLASAHKSPKLVEEILEKDYDIVITGAGLSAALPGVIAAAKTVPVLGIPCPGAYDALDAFLSIAQMPPGVPVLEVSAENAVGEAKKILAKKEKVAIAGEGKAAEKAKKQLDEMGISYEMGAVAEDAINIVTVAVGEESKASDALIIYCPDGATTAEDAIKVMKGAKHGLWVGVGRGENAAIAAAEIMGKKEALAESRKKFEEKCRRQDEEVRK